MILHSAEFMGSFPELKKCPRSENPEYAFIGRSNVGKSSLINMLTNRKGLAKTSSTPGKTQTINLFNINDEWILTDLPGIGYAKTSKAIRSTWELMIHTYLSKRENLVNIFYLVDARLELQKNDLEFMKWMAEEELPFVIVFTKSDKVGTIELQKNLASFKKKLLEYWEVLPSIFLTSSEKQKGKDDILLQIENFNKDYWAYLESQGD